MSAVSMNMKNLNLTQKGEDIPLPPPLPPKVGRVKQGIVSILGSEAEQRNCKTASIRRTLSADMSSKKWLAQNGLMMKKVASSQHLADQGQDDVWNSIQNNKKEQPALTTVGVWSSILSQKKEDDSSSADLPPPYIHPTLLKKTSSLNEKSLEICTESLGSETGSDQSFSSYPPSEIDEDHHQQQQQEFFSHSFEEDIPVVKYNKRSSSPAKSFPPPITSLAREDKPCVHMQSHRQNGRLILEAVSVPPQNLFRANRVDGRLLLTLITTNPASETENQAQENAEFDDIQELDLNETPHDLDYESDDGYEEEQEEEEYDDEEEESGTKGMQIVLDNNPRMNVNTCSLMMKQLMGLNKKDHLAWSNNFINSTDPPSAAAPAASFNAYEYFWRKNSTVTTMNLNSFPTKNNYNDNQQVVQEANYSTTVIANSTKMQQQDLVLMRGNNKENINYLVKGCKEQRRSLLIWEPHCIATS